MPIPKNKLLSLIIASTLIIVTISIWHLWRTHPPKLRNLTAEDISPVVILPFDTKRAGEDWQWLSTGLIDLLATKLNMPPSLQAVCLEWFLEEINPLSLRSGLKIQPPEAISLFGARSALVGEASVQNGSLRLEIKLLGQDGRTSLFEDHQNLDDPLSIFTTVDTLCQSLIEALEWEQTPTLLPSSELITQSLPAYRHYVMAVEDYIISDEISLPRAADHLTLAVAADSAFARAHFLRAKVSDQAQSLDISLDFPEDALTLALQFPQRLPEWERFYALGWRLWMVDGDLDGAVAVLRDLVLTYREYSWHQGVPLTLGRLLAHQGRWPEAIDELEEYVRSKETPRLRKMIGWSQLALGHQVTGRLDETVEALEQELTLYSDHQSNLYWWIDENMKLALLYFEQGEEAHTEEVIQRVETVAPGDARSLAMIGLARFGMQQISRTEILAEKSLRQSSDLAVAHYLRGILSLRQKQYWQAVADLEAACTQEFNWDFLYHAAIAHYQRGDRESAQELWELLVDVLGGDEPQAVAATDLGTLGILLSRLGKEEEALKQGHEALTRFPYPQSKYDLASIYAIQGDKSEAMKWLRAAYADGFVNRRQSRVDFNLENLWYDPDFILLTSPE